MILWKPEYLHPVVIQAVYTQVDLLAKRKENAQVMKKEKAIRELKIERPQRVVVSQKEA